MAPSGWMGPFRSAVMTNSTIAQNRRARHDYEILQRYEAGIVLTGSEIKSVRDHKVQLQGAYARVKGGEVWLEDAHIAPYANAGYAPHNPTRDRKLLLHKKEIAKIEEALGEKGLTLVPLANATTAAITATPPTPSNMGSGLFGWRCGATADGTNLNSKYLPGSCRGT